MLAVFYWALPPPNLGGSKSVISVGAYRGPESFKFHFTGTLREQAFRANSAHRSEAACDIVSCSLLSTVIKSSSESVDFDHTQVMGSYANRSSERKNKPPLLVDFTLPLPFLSNSIFEFCFVNLLRYAPQPWSVYWNLQSVRALHLSSVVLRSSVVWCMFPFNSSRCSRSETLFRVTRDFKYSRFPGTQLRDWKQSSFRWIWLNVKFRDKGGNFLAET